MQGANQRPLSGWSFLRVCVEGLRGYLRQPVIIEVLTLESDAFWVTSALQRWGTWHTTLIATTAAMATRGCGISSHCLLPCRSLDNDSEVFFAQLDLHT